MVRKNKVSQSKLKDKYNRSLSRSTLFTLKPTILKNGNPKLLNYDRLFFKKIKKLTTFELQSYYLKN